MNHRVANQGGDQALLLPPLVAVHLCLWCALKRAGQLWPVCFSLCDGLVLLVLGLCGVLGVKAHFKDSRGLAVSGDREDLLLRSLTLVLWVGLASVSTSKHLWHPCTWS